MTANADDDEYRDVIWLRDVKQYWRLVGKVRELPILPLQVQVTPFVHAGSLIPFAFHN